MKKILLIIFLLHTLLIYSQNNNQKLIDSLHNCLPEAKNDTVKARIYIKLENALRQSDPNKALEYAKKSLSIVKKMNWKKGLSVCYNDIGNNYSDRGLFDLSLKNFLESLKNSQDFPQIRVSTFGNIANLYLKQDNFEMVLKYNNYVLEIAEKEGLIASKAKAFQMSGFVFEMKNDLENAKLQFKKSLVLFQKIEDEYKQANLLMNLGDASKSLKDKIYYYQNSKKILDRLNPEDILAVSNLLGLATAYIDLANNEKEIAQFYPKKNKGKLLLEAEEYLNKSISYSKKSEIKENLVEAYAKMALLKKSKGDFKKALLYSTKSHNLYDSIFSQENKNKIAKLENQKEIELKNKQIQINSISLKVKEKEKLYLISGIFLLAIIGGLLLYQNKNRAKTNTKLQVLNDNLEQANTTKTKLLNILNHDLRSPVNNFIHYIQFQNENPEVLDDKTKSRIENETLTSAKNLLFSMEDILLWTKDQMQNFHPKLVNTEIKLVFDATDKHFSSEKNVTITFENSENLFLITDENFLKTILRNLTANALKAFENLQTDKVINPHIIWKAWQNESNIYLSITDNGPGANLENFKALYNETEVVGIKTGLGLHLIRDLAKAINCEIKVESRLNRGTTIKLLF